MIIHNPYPVKSVTRIFSCLYDGSLVGFKNETKSDGNSIIFLVKAMENPWLELVQNPCHAWAWKTNKTWINDMKYETVMEFGVDLDQIHVDLSDETTWNFHRRTCHIFYRVSKDGWRNGVMSWETVIKKERVLDMR